MDADLIYTENKDEVPNLYSAFLLWGFKVIYMLSGKRRELGDAGNPFNKTRRYLKNAWQRVRK